MREEMALEKQENGVSALVDIESARATQEVQAAMIVAKRFPRDEMAAYQKIMKACERPGLAKEALYAYPRGGKMVTGPSIRLAEAMAQAWGNLDFGIRELSQRDGVSEIEAYCWDLETNTRQTKTFNVKHGRFTRAKGLTMLNDPRDIYEVTANQGARRVRACILGIIPGDITEAAVTRSEETMTKGDGKPLVDRIRDMVTAFQEFGVTQEMIEARLGHKLDATIATEVVALGKIYKSLKDNMSQREQWFDLGVADKKAADDLTEKVKKPKKEKKKEVKSEEAPLQYSCPNQLDEEGNPIPVLALQCKECEQREGCPAHD